MVHHEGRRRTSTLSISLPHELAQAISEHLETGLYTSASELIREALRLFLKVEDAQRAQLERLGRAAPPGFTSGEALRFATAMQLFDLGSTLSREMHRAAGGEDTGDDPRDRLRRWEEEREAGPGLRIARDRLAKLRSGEPGSGE